MLTILLLAAGSSSRMGGRDKLMEEVEGKPLIRTMAERALDTGCDVMITLPPTHAPRQEALRDLDLGICRVEDAAKGMAHSIRAGVACLPAEATAAMILPADMPELDRSDLETMVSTWKQSPADAILRGATQDGRAGHPVIFPKRDFAALTEISGDQGARAILKENADRVRLVRLPGNHALTDLDTPQAWEAWRKSQG